MTPFLGEFIGTALLVILGDGVVANVILNKTKGFNSGWMVITLGWAMAVFVAVYIAAPFSGAHLNPAVTVGLAVAEKFAWADVPMYIGAQLGGAFIGAVIMWVTYKKHFDETTDAATILAVFATGPAILHSLSNIVSEVVGTFVLIFGVLYIASPQSSLGALDALPVALLVLSIGLSLGGTTGYAINPARDLGPRIAHAILPIKHKGPSDWAYAWIPIVAPIVGAVLAALAFINLKA
jgi:glycerol uptake facilitator protein